MKGEEVSTEIKKREKGERDEQREGERKKLTIKPDLPERLLIFFQLFLGGLTLKTIPSLNGSKLSKSSNSASPPKVIIWYISFSFNVIIPKPPINISNRCPLKASYSFLVAFRSRVLASRSATRSRKRPF